MGEDSLLFMVFHDLLNDVIKLSCYEELIAEIKKMKGKSISDIVTKLTLIVIAKKIGDYGKEQLYNFISDIQGLSEVELQSYITNRTQLIERQKEQIEAEIGALLEVMELSGDERLEFYVMYAKYFEELGQSKYEFMKTINLMLDIDEQRQNGQVVNIDVNTIFELLKNYNGMNKRSQSFGEEQLLGEDFPGTSGRGH